MQQPVFLCTFRFYSDFSSCRPWLYRTLNSVLQPMDPPLALALWLTSPITAGLAANWLAPSSVWQPHPERKRGLGKLALSLWSSNFVPLNRLWLPHFDTEQSRYRTLNQGRVGFCAAFLLPNTCIHLKFRDQKWENI